MKTYKLKTNKIEEKVVEAYKKVEDGTVNVYKGVENAVVGVYKTIEKKFVDKFLEEQPEKEVTWTKSRMKIH